MGPTTGDKQERANLLAEDLLGSAGTLPKDIAGDPELCQLLGYILHRCEGCECWVEVHEVDEDGYCEDCQED